MKSIHKRWFILMLITCCVLASLGFGRFSFGAILPFMKNGLQLNYQQTGYLASSIFLGYLIAVIVAGYIVLRFKAKKVIIFSLVLLAIGMLITAISTSFYTAYIGCTIIGLGTGGVYVPSLGLLGQWFSLKSRGMAMGIAMAGSGIGMVFSGFTIPILIKQAGMNGWRIGWGLLSLLIILIALINLLFLKSKPEGRHFNPNKESVEKEQQNKSDLAVSVYLNKTLWFLGLVYFAWGASYLVFSTFLVDFLIVDIGTSNESAGTFFAVAGITSILSGFIWGSLSDRVGRLVTLIIVFLLQTILLFALSLSTNSLLLVLITAMYGVTLWAVPTIINASVSDFIAPQYITIGMGFVTVFFSTGQLVSPIITGFLIDYSNSYFMAFLFSSISALLGGFGCIKLALIHRRNKQKATIEMNVVDMK